MSKIITITFNPSIDKTASVKKLIPEKKLYCTEPIFEPGGGGINVARAIKKLGGEAIAIYPAGGYTGQFFNHLLEKESVPAIVIEVEHPMRENVVVLEENSNNQFRFGFPGAKLNEHEWKRCLEEIEKMDDVQYIVASGSIPEGVPHDIFARLAAIAKSKNDKLIVDTSDKALKLAAEEGVYLMKPNIGELAWLVGKNELTIEEVPEAGKEIVSSGCCEVLVISMGEDGAMLITKDAEFTVKSPHVKKRSTVGAGDSMVAGIVLELSRGRRIEEAFLYGVASGTAATMNIGTELCHKQDVDKLYQELISRYKQNIIVHA
ncbi:MAG TPA: 1-phosphofructokinase family hexose kinase [Chitinophagaceae bacterium]|jgi:6-phosphofructokinase 2|nr:1-phosphofructokinase family hexose kinase [Chitinophagaceae bacterium]